SPTKQWRRLCTALHRYARNRLAAFLLGLNGVALGACENTTFRAFYCFCAVFRVFRNGCGQTVNAVIRFCASRKGGRFLRFRSVGGALGRWTARTNGKTECDAA